jgi:CheY-like chemotaxis protein/nitrogen-specific signal transduction histidine kinase
MFDRFHALIVDDQDLMRSVTASQLRAMGFAKVLSAKNGADALKLMRAQRVDAVLSDWNMPLMNGVELLRAVRTDNKLAMTPFLMITSETGRGRIQDVITSGVNGLLVKPYNAGQLRDRLERILSPSPRPTGQMPNPRRADTGQHGDDSLDSPTMAPPARVLVVDDNATSLSVLDRLFRDDYEVVTANRGAAALGHCRVGSMPDLVLIDVQMPEMDGFETVRQMRDMPLAADIPVIFVTADTSDEARRKGMKLGAVDFVTKNTPPRELRQRVRNFLRFVELRKQLQSEYDTMIENARLREQVDNMTRHDLKGSLSGIVGMVTELSDDDAMPAQFQGKLNLVRETASHALTSVNMAGEMYKIETGRFKLVPQPVAIGDLLRSLAEMSRAAFAHKEVGVVVDTDVPVGQPLPLAWGDETLCHSLFGNLIKNACEAAPARSKVTVTLRDTALLDQPLRVTVENKGTVPLEIRQTFFDKFVTHGKKGGTGVGTYSARMLVKAQGGKIKMSTSDQDNLTTLTVWLPRQPGGGADTLAALSADGATG